MDEEVAEVELEAVAGVVQCEQTLDEGLNLLTVKVLINVVIEKSVTNTYVVRLGKAVCKRLATKPPRKSLLLVPGATPISGV